MKLVFTACVSIFAFAFLAAHVFAEDKNSDGPKVASVNGAVITQTELDKEAGRFEQQMAMTGQPASSDQLADMKKKVLEGMVNRELLVQQSKKLGVKVEDSEVDAQLASLKKRFPNEADFTNALGKMNTSEEELKTQFRRDMTIKKMIDQEVMSKVSLSNEEAKTFYDGNPDFFKMPETVRASHILVKVESNESEADKAKAKEKISQIQKRIKKGEDFAAVAKETSDCPSAAKGGDLDFFQKGQMVKPFEDAAFALKVGDVSDIVETQFGYHIIKVTDKKDASTAPFDEVKEKIEEHLKQQKSNQQVTQYIDQLKAGAKIEIVQ